MKACPLLIAAALLFAGAANAAPDTGHLQPFASEKAFQSHLAKLKAKEAEARRKAQGKNVDYAYDTPMPTAMPAPPAAAASEGKTLEKVEVTGSRISQADAGSDAITNVQTQGVDEGGIVKKLGDYLIVLRRGRIFSIEAGADQLRPVSSINAYGPGISPQGAWYDEMLISGRTIVVIGYSYARGGTEVGLFHIDDSGRLSYRNTYHLRSNDYYSSRNYASRLIGRQLIFYSPMSVNLYGDSADSLPAVRPWQERPGAFKRILPATEIYQTGLAGSAYDLTLHSVTTCDITTQSTLDCRAKAVLGPSSRVFYVAAEAVYVWIGGSGLYGRARKPNESMLLRMPLGSGAPQALRVSGNPIDQMSFLERDGYINVLVGSQSNGDGMWRAEGKAGALALLRAPLRSFGNAGARSQDKHYRPLPAEYLWGIQNRYVGDWLIYGSQYARGGDTATYAVPYARGGQAVPLALKHSTERIEALGNDALVVGNAGNDLVFSSVRLDAKATPVSGYIQRNAVQSESRTHGFFYQPQGEANGILGLPILGDSEERPSAAVKYLRNKKLQLSDLGLLVASSGKTRDDGCQVSCVDWYGNARPVFIGDRVYALMGYELVEGRVYGDSLVELRRVNYAPRAAQSR
ncbi:MAG TPA: beta-propeller domain-containing protein [Arenimonas sp.]|nr:beta-propeller domain-containing protein [Arenimonas sp.]